MSASAYSPEEPNRRALYTFGSAHFLNDLVTAGLVPALVVMYKGALHLNYIHSTLIVFVSYLTSSISQPLFGLAADRTPRVWLLTVGVLLSIGGLSLTAIAGSLPWLLVFIGLSGLGSGIFHPEASRGTHLAAGLKPGLAQSIFQVGGNAGQAVGPLLVPLFLVRTGIHGLIWLLPLAFLSLILTGQILPWLGGQVGKSDPRRRRTVTGKNNLAGVALLASVIMLRSWCQLGVVVFLPFYLHHLSLASSETLNFVFVGAGALGTLIGGTLSDKLGRKRLVVASMAVATPFALLFSHLSGSLRVMDLLLFGFSVLSSFSVTVVYMQRLLPNKVALASGLSIGFSIGAGGIGSLFLSGLSDALGVAAVFTVLSFLPLAGGILALFLPNL